MFRIVSLDKMFFARKFMFSVFAVVGPVALSGEVQDVEACFCFPQEHKEKNLRKYKQQQVQDVTSQPKELTKLEQFLNTLRQNIKNFENEKSEKEVLFQEARTEVKELMKSSELMRSSSPKKGSRLSGFLKWNSDNPKVLRFKALHAAISLLEKRIQASWDMVVTVQNVEQSLKKTEQEIENSKDEKAEKEALLQEAETEVKRLIKSEKMQSLGKKGSLERKDAVQRFRNKRSNVAKLIQKKTLKDLISVFEKNIKRSRKMVEDKSSEIARLISVFEKTIKKSQKMVEDIMSGRIYPAEEISTNTAA